MFAWATRAMWLRNSQLTILLAAFLVPAGINSAIGQDQPPPETPEEKPQAEPQKPADPPAETKPAGPVRTGRQGNVGKSRANRQPGNPAGQPIPNPNTPPAEEVNPDVQRKIDDLLRNRARGEEPDPELQRQIDELLRSQGVGGQPGQTQPGQVQPNAAQPQNTQLQPPQPADPAPKPDPREAARQRAEERRKRLQQQQQNPAGDQGDPSGQPAGDAPGSQPPSLPPPQQFPQPGQEGPSGPTQTINIPAAENPVPPDERTYGFSIKNGTYEQLIEGFARQTGMGVIGDLPQGGTLNFITTEQLSFAEALSRVRMLLFNYKPHEPYWLLRNKENLQVIRVTDLYRIIPRDRVYQSLEEYRAAGLSPEEIVLVFFTPTQGTVADLMVARDFLPDYVRITPVAENRVAMFALVKDIERYLEFIPIVAGSGEDARVIERIECKSITPTDAVSKLSQMMPLDSSGARVQQVSRGVRSAPAAQELANIPEPSINVIPDDMQGVIIVRAMPAKIAEIKRLMTFIDVDLAVGAPAPVVVQLKHTRSDEVIPVLQQMLTSSSSTPDAAGVAAPRPPRRSRRTSTTSGAAASGGATSASTDAVAVIAHPSNTAIILLASDPIAIEDTRKLIDLVDVPNVTEWIELPVANADVETLKETLLSMVADGAGSKPELAAMQMFADPSGRSLWFSGSERDLERVRSLIAKLDVAGDPVKYFRHVLEFQDANFVVSMLREFDGTGSASAVPTATPMPSQPGERPRTKIRGLSTRRGGTPSASKFTAEDDGRTVWVLCTEKEWPHYLQIIEQIDVAPNENPPFVRVAVEHISAEKAVERLSSMIGGTSSDMSSEIRLLPAGDSILVVGATPRELERLKVFLAEADKPSQIEQRIYDIKFGDAAEIKAAIEALVTGDSSAVSSGGSAARRFRPKPVEGQPNMPAVPGAGGATAGEPVITEELTIFQTGNRLIVRAHPEKLTEIEGLIAILDIQNGASQIKVYDKFPTGADIEGMADMITSVMSGAPQPRGSIRPRDAAGAGGGSGPRLIPQPGAGRLIVIADPADFPKIEELLEVLRFESPKEKFVVDFIQVKHANPDDVVEAIEPVLAIKIRGLVTSGELVDANAAPAATEGPAAIQRLTKAARGQRDTGDRYHIASDSRNKRIVVAAPQVIIDEVRQLVMQFDISGDLGEVVFRTIELTNATPTEMIRAIKEMFGKPSPQRVASVKRPVQGGQIMPNAGGDGATGESLTIVEAPGGNSIILHGVKADVEQAITWIKELDALSNLGRVVKVYKIQNADLSVVFDLLVSLVDTATRVATAPQAPRSVRMPLGKGEEEESDEPEFETKKTYTSADMYLHADLLGGTILVATTPGKIQQIEHLLKSFEEDETIASALDKAPAIPKFTYRLKYADPTDAAWDLKDALKLYWDPPDQLPQVESSSLFDELVVRYPDETKFDEIRRFIRDYADKPDPELVKKTNKVFLSPEGYPADFVARRLAGSLKGVEIEVVDDTPEKIDDHGIEIVVPAKNDRRGGHPCVLPTSLLRTAAAATGAALAQTPQGQEPPADEPEPRPQPVDEDEPADLQDDLIRQAAPPPTIRVETAPAPADSERPKDEADEEEPDDDIYAGQKVKIIYNRETGEIRYEGPAGKIEQIEEVITDLKDEELPAPPDIRIARVRYIDVYSAQDIIEEMFNATRQQRQEAMQMQQQQARMAQQMAQQAARAQQQSAQRGQQPGQRGGRGEEEDPRQHNQQQLMQQMQAPQLPPTTVRVYPNPRDRTLILRADTSQYPQIFKLLATIDQPKPLNSEMRVFPLKKLNAKEVEEMLRQMLNLDGGSGRRATRSRAPSMPGMDDGGGPSPATSGPGSSLPKTILQETVGGTNQLGVDPEDIKLFASEASNSIVVTAPLAAIEFIEKTITQLESGDLPQRLTKYYKLLHASAEDVVGYLSAHFAADSGGAKPKPAGEGAGTTVAGGGAPNAPSFIAYSQLNQITVQATEPQIAEIDDIIARLDVSSGTTSWRDVPVLYVDAAQAATTLNEMYGNKSGAPGATGKTSGVVPRFIGTEGSGIVLFSAPENLHKEILDTIAKLEEKYKAPSIIRVLQLKFADPTTVAEAIQKAYEPRSGTKGAAPSAKFTITPHNTSRQLFVKAPDELFNEINSLVASLDKPGDMPEFRIYKLKHANAKSIHAMLTKLVGEYLQRLGQDKGGFGSEAFSVQPEESANALIVLGGPVVFGFVEENLRQIDQPDATSGPMVSVTIPLTNVDAAELAATLTASWSQRGMAPELMPQIHANRQANSLIIRANQGQIDEMKKSVIEPLEQQGVKMTGEVRIVQLKYGDASEIKAALEEYLRKGGGGGRPGELIGDVRLSPMVQSNSLMLAGAKEEVNRLVGIIETMDLAGELGNVPQIIPLKHVNASLLVTMIEELFAGQGTNRRGSTPPVIAADPTGKFLVVRADASDMGSIEKMVEKLDTEDQAGKDPYKIVSVKAGINVELLAEQVETSVNESARRRMVGKGTDVPAIMATPDSRTNTITIAGSPALFADAEGMIKTLEGMGPAGAPSTRVIGGMRLGKDEVDKLIQHLTQGSSGESRGRRSSARPQRGGSN